MRGCRLVLLSFGLCLWASMASAQATQTSRFALDQGAPDLATAQSYTYRVYADGAATGATIAMICTGTASPFVCTALVGAFTPGSHTVTFTAANVAGESPKSAPLTFTMVIIPAVPLNPRIQ